MSTKNLERAREWLSVQPLPGETDEQLLAQLLTVFELDVRNAALDEAIAECSRNVKLVDVLEAHAHAVCCTRIRALKR